MLIMDSPLSLADLFHHFTKVFFSDYFLCIFCIKCPKRVSVDLLDFYPGEDSKDGLDEEGQEEECFGEHHGHQDH